MARTTQRKTGRVTADLIAVLCILLLVAAFVQPIRARSRRTPGCVCQSNLKQLWKALAMYWNDYDATLPSSYLYGRSKTWNPQDFIRFAKEQGTLPALPNATRQSWPMVLSDYLADYRCLWCPSDHSRSNSPTARVSYYWRAATDRAWYAGHDLRKESGFLYPADQIIFYEHNSWHYGGRDICLADGAVINCAFMDGHAGALVIRESGYTRRENPPEPLPASGVGEPAWFNYSLGEAGPRFDRGQNWDPTIWADAMVELPTKCEDPVVTCQDNLRRLAAAVSIYTGDWDDALPSSCLYGHNSTWNADDFVGFASERGTLPPSSEVERSSWPMALYLYYSRSDRVLWCPLDDGKSRDPSARVSYYWKAAVDAAWYGGPDGIGPEARHGNDYLFPANQIVLYERNPWHGRAPRRGLADRAIINCAFLDGHVGLKTVRDSGYGRRELPAGPLPTSGVGEPAWFNYSFGAAGPVFSRGYNWDPRIWGDNLP